MPDTTASVSPFTKPVMVEVNPVNTFPSSVLLLSSAVTVRSVLSTITVKASPVLVQPVVVLVTVIVPLYVSASAAAGTVKAIGEAGSATLLTSAKPAVIAAGLHTILYSLGLSVVAE